MNFVDTVKNALVPINREGYPFIAAFAVATILLGLLSTSLFWIGLILTAWCAYFFRDPERVTPVDDRLVVSPADGVVSAVGAGMNYAAPLAELIRRADVDILMCAGRFTLLDDSALDDLLPLAQERNVSIVAAGVYNSGLLGKPRPAADALFDYAPAPPEMLARAHAIADVCEAHGVTLPEAAIAYVRRHPAVVSVVLGARGRGQIDSNAQRSAADVPEALWSDLAAAGLIPDAPCARLASFNAIISRATSCGTGSPTPAAWESTMFRCSVSRSRASMRTLASLPKPVLTP